MPDIPIWYYPIGLLMLMLTVSISAVRLTAKFDTNCKSRYWNKPKMIRARDTPMWLNEPQEAIT